MIISSDLSHKTRKEWQDMDPWLRRIIDALEEVRPHSNGSLYAWLNSGKGYYTFRTEMKI